MVAESLSRLESTIIDNLPDKFMRRPLNPFKFPFLLPFRHRLMEQCFEHRFYDSMESNCQPEVFNYDSTFGLNSHGYPKLQLFKVEAQLRVTFFTLNL